MFILCYNVKYERIICSFYVHEGDKMKVCCGFGHRTVYEPIGDALNEAIEGAIREGCELFLTGAMGQFDRMFAYAVRQKKQTHPNIRLICVKPYHTAGLNAGRERYAEDYDDVLIPAELLGLHPKAAIGARNRWMIDQSDLVIVYVKHEFGGAYQALRYAQRNGKQLLLL